MSQHIEVVAELREDIGKGASRRLRRLANKVPGILYGADKDPVALTMEYKTLSKLMELEAFFSQILDVKVGKKKQAAVLRDVQRHPGTGNVTHLDFLRISEDKALHIHVPLHFLNEDTCVGVRTGGGTISHNLIEIEISCLPRDLPEYIEIDVAEVELGSSLHLSDVVVPEGVTIIALTYGEDRDITVMSVQVPRGGADDEEAVDTEDQAAGDSEGADESASDEEGSSES